MKQKSIPPANVEKRNREISHLVVTETEAAKMLGVSVQTLRNHRCARKGLPYAKFGRFVRYFTDDIEAYLRDHRVDPEAR